jgi:RimJ/RimL family protein N-acetyltransferase
VYAALSDQSCYQRFLGIRRPLSDGELDRLLTVDHWHHEALIAFSSAPRRPLGTARYVRGERFDTAELAIEVIDTWQRHGIGSQLVGALRTRALATGIRRFTASMAPGNAGAVALARRLGPRTVVDASHGAIEIAIDLGGAG